MPPPSAAETARWAVDPDAADAWQLQQSAVMAERAKASVARIAARLSAGSDVQQVAARVLMGDIDGAALLASRTADVAAFQMAMGFCTQRAGQPETPHCSALTAQRWAVMDPTDARPWLGMLDEARRRGDEAGVRRALAEIAARPRLSSPLWMLEAQVLPLLDIEPDQALRLFALVQVLGTDAAMPLVGMSALTATCREREAAWPERMPLCRAAARQMLSASNTLMDAALALAVAERSGLARAEQAWDRATLKAMMEAYGQDASPQVSMACGMLDTWVRFGRQRAAIGELRQAEQALRQRRGR